MIKAKAEKIQESLNIRKQKTIQLKKLKNMLDNLAKGSIVRLHDKGGNAGNYIDVETWMLTSLINELELNISDIDKYIDKA